MTQGVVNSLALFPGLVVSGPLLICLLNEMHTQNVTTQFDCSLL